MVFFLSRRQRFVFYKSDDVFNSVVLFQVEGQVMHPLFWDKLEPFVMVINRNRCCKPKFALQFQVRSFIPQPVLY